jgi:hypothetical protein
MNILSKLNTAADAKGEVNSLGGNAVWDTGLYSLTITMAYLMPAKTGALGLVLNYEGPDGRKGGETLYVTSGDAKGNLTYSVDTKTNEKRNLPGYNLANSLCLLTVGKELSEMDTEDKMVEVYNFETKSNVPTTVPVLTDLLRCQILGGIIKQKVDKNQKADDGKYYPTGEFREEGTLDKFFRASDRMSVPEILAEAPASKFAGEWESKFTSDFVKDRTVKDAGSKLAASGAFGKAAAAAGKPTKSLFGQPAA